MRLLAYQAVALFMPSKPLILEENPHPSRFQRYHVPPEIPFRRAKEFRLKRRKLIHEGVAETVDFKDILSRSRRFLNSQNHLFPVKKPVVIESRVAAALNQQGNKSSISGRPDLAVQLGYFKWYGQFGHDSSSMQSDERCIVDSGWPDYKYESAETLHKSRLFEDVTSKDVSGAAEDHRSLLLSSCVKQYKPKMTNGCITWSDDFETVCDPAVSSSSDTSDTFEEPFRDVPYILREIIRDRLHLLESHIVDVHGSDAATAAADVDASAADYTDADADGDINGEDLVAMIEDNFNPNYLAASCGITEEDYTHGNAAEGDNHQITTTHDDDNDVDNCNDNNSTNGNDDENDDDNDRVSDLKKRAMLLNNHMLHLDNSDDQILESRGQGPSHDLSSEVLVSVKVENENNNDDVYNMDYDDYDDYNGNDDGDENSCDGGNDDVTCYGEESSPTLRSGNGADRINARILSDDESVDTSIGSIQQRGDRDKDDDGDDDGDDDPYNSNDIASSRRNNAAKEKGGNENMKGSRGGNKKSGASQHKKNLRKGGEKEKETDNQSGHSSSDSGSDGDSDSDSSVGTGEDKDNTHAKCQPQTIKKKTQIKSEHSLPNGMFEIAARKILFPIDVPDSVRKKRRGQKNVAHTQAPPPTSLPFPSCPNDVAAVLGELYDNQVRTFR